MQGIESQSSKVGTGPSDFLLVLFPVSLVDDIVGIWEGKEFVQKRVVGGILMSEREELELDICNIVMCAGSP